MNWVGPYTIDDLLDRVAVDWESAPPESDGVYLISLKPWSGQPSEACGPLYVGGNTGTSARFRTRIGDLIADLFGFYGETTGHHSGGQRLNSYCAENKINPKQLFIGWAKDCNCGRCSEVNLHSQLRPTLNRKSPPACRTH